LFSYLFFFDFFVQERRILISTDGPYGNVLKLKPPMYFDQQDADHLVNELRSVLFELANIQANAKL
jgi:4-aminobutyrate aminotransferase-like enzyme